MTFAGMKRVGDGFYDDGHGALHVDLDEFVRAAGGDPGCEADVERAVQALRDNHLGVPVMVFDQRGPA